MKMSYSRRDKFLFQKYLKTSWCWDLSNMSDASLRYKGFVRYHEIIKISWDPMTCICSMPSISVNMIVCTIRTEVLHVDRYEGHH